MGHVSFVAVLPSYSYSNFADFYDQLVGLFEFLVYYSW